MSAINSAIQQLHWCRTIGRWYFWVHANPALKSLNLQWELFQNESWFWLTRFCLYASKIGKCVQQVSYNTSKCTVYNFTALTLGPLGTWCCENACSTFWCAMTITCNLSLIDYSKPVCRQEHHWSCCPWIPVSSVGWTDLCSSVHSWSETEEFCLLTQDTLIWLLPNLYWFSCACLPLEWLHVRHNYKFVNHYLIISMWCT